MKRVLRFLRFCLLSLIIVVVLAGALFAYFVYSPDPELPRLSGTLAKGSIEVGGLERTYLTYVPQGLTKGAPLVWRCTARVKAVRKCECKRGMGSSTLRTTVALRSSIPTGTKAIGTRATLSVTTARTSSTSTM